MFCTTCTARQAEPLCSANPPGKRLWALGCLQHYLKLLAFAFEFPTVQCLCQAVKRGLGSCAVGSIPSRCAPRASRDWGGLLHWTATSEFPQPLAALSFLVSTCKRGKKETCSHVRSTPALHCENALLAVAYFNTSWRAFSRTMRYGLLSA